MAGDPSAHAPDELRQRDHPRRLYFVNAPIDFALIGGLSVVLYVIFLCFQGEIRTASAVGIAAQLSWVVNWPHFSATNYRLYQSRENIRQYPMTALAEYLKSPEGRGLEVDTQYQDKYLFSLNPGGCLVRRSE